MPIKKSAPKKAAARKKAATTKTASAPDGNAEMTLFGDVNILGGVAKCTCSVELKVSHDYQSAGVHKAITFDAKADEAEDAVEKMTGHLREATVSEIPNLRLMIEAAIG